ncbi:MAG: HPr family phosphocarrier protein [Candidatus Omnitrophica bacterium]|nr:HPr family phosphocarrier protein [Candidatus Omnitrophota bacterium]
MEYKTVTVENPNGIHLRPAAKIVNISKKYNSRISLSCKNCPFVDADSIMQLLLLQATKGAQVTVKAEGPDEKEAVKEITHFFTDGAGI